MQTYANHAFRYDHYEDRASDESQKTGARRSQRSSRRRSRKRTTSTPGMTINGRRGRRWGW
ncbi:hypothetical protein [Botrimarina mediterranea]|uniref:Uncharacterized protein n=1 Tax=Botrimarina mediterranea TaxID=2528022 RepID=A0A518KC40_9BACT|nr:hypothetical protein [Botrimarina mediterranea]QDV75366.1 hypothetical protein Spa11_35820 [Botrimarina mediterranea]QDV80036.1 hypothetical protein K2D_36580 [Planctomycetes bacterium K2D]